MNYGRAAAQESQAAATSAGNRNLAAVHQFEPRRSWCGERTFIPLSGVQIPGGSPEDDLSPAKGILLAALMGIGVYLAVVCIFSLQ